MKKTIGIILVSVGMLIPAFSYTVAVTDQSNFNNPDLPIVDNTGAGFSGGSVWVGYFAGGDSAVDPASFSSTVGAFTQFGTESLSVTGAAPGLIDLTSNAGNGLFDGSIPNGGNAFTGQNIYVIFGNDAATLANSTLMAVWKSNTTFGQEDALGNGGATVDLVTGGGTLVLGTDPGSTTIGPVTFSNGIGLVEEVPEPSVSLLAGLGLLGLLRRRR